MLTSLSIRNVVLIDKLDLYFQKGLGVLTGETGAGKSILLDALGLAIGMRAETGLLRQGEDRAVVSATFEIPSTHAALSQLSEQGLDIEEQLVLRRIVSADGRSRAFINDQPVSVGLLRAVGNDLIEIQGQFEQHGLLNTATHLPLLDAFAGLKTEAKNVSHAYQAWHAAADELDRLQRAAAKAAEDEEYLRHAVEELDRLAPQENEESELAKMRTDLMQAEQIAASLKSAQHEITNKANVAGALHAALRHLERIAETSGGSVDGAVTALDRCLIEYDEAINQISEASHAINLDAGQLGATEERLFALREVARKHRTSVDNLTELHRKFCEQLSLIDDQSSSIRKLQKQAAELRTKYTDAAAKLSKARQQAAVRLDKAVIEELQPLRLGGAQFHTQIEQKEEKDWNADGMDRVSFQVATNPGEAMGPLAKFASGGELSRFMLALKVVLAASDARPTLIFDEIDSGVGGATADAIGERLERLAEHMQIFVVTHSPQVAARGREHFLISKSEANGRVRTTVNNLDMAAREDELARMLSGSTVTTEARANAGRLIKGLATQAAP